MIRSLVQIFFIIFLAHYPIQWLKFNYVPGERLWSIMGTSSILNLSSSNASTKGPRITTPSCEASSLILVVLSSTNGQNKLLKEPDLKLVSRLRSRLGKKGPNSLANFTEEGKGVSLANCGYNYVKVSVRFNIRITV